MGSRHPLDRNLPFGCTLNSPLNRGIGLGRELTDASADIPDATDSPATFAHDGQPGPASREPLLSEHEIRSILSFLESFQTSGPTHSISFGEGIGFTDGWISLPPQLVGHATASRRGLGLPMVPPLNNNTSPLNGHTGPSNEHASLLNGHAAWLHGHAGPLIGHTGPLNRYATPMEATFAFTPPPSSTMSSPPLQQHQIHRPVTTVEHHQPSPEVAAAATLLRGGALPVHHTSERGSYDATNSHPQAMSSSLHDPRCQPIPDLGYGNRGLSMSSGSDTSLSQPLLPPVELQWGSDTSFGAHLPFGHVPGRGSLAAGPSGSVLQGGLRSLNLRDLSPRQSDTRFPKVAPKDDDSADVSPRGRRRLSAEDEDDDEDDDDDDDDEDEDDLDHDPSPRSVNPSRKAGRKRKPNAEPSVSTTVSEDVSIKRRKSSANISSRPPRENLSDEQKRENHIRSEQKRRTMIREGFDDLFLLVPGLEGSGFSKSAMLAKSREWLIALLNGNRSLDLKPAPPEE